MFSYFVLPLALFSTNESTIISRNPAANISSHFRQSNKFTMGQAVSQALRSNPKVRALLLDISASERGVASNRALTNPLITLTPGITRQGSDEEFIISQPLEINGTRTARVGIATAQRRAVEAQSLIGIREIVYQTKISYLQLVKAQERLALAKELATNAEELDRIAARQVELGSRSGIEKTQTSIEVTRAKQQLTLADAEYDSALAELNNLIGKPSQFEGLEKPTFSQVAFDEAELLRIAITNRAEIALTKANRDVYLQSGRLALAEGLPDIAPQFRAGSVFHNPRESGFGISISIPLLDHGSRKNRIRQAEESAKAEEQRTLSASNQVEQEVRQAITRLQAASQVVATYQQGMLSETRKLLDATRKGFQLGEATVITVIEAQRTFRSVQTEFIDALISHEQAKAQLERATGGVPASIIKDLRATEKANK